MKGLVHIYEGTGKGKSTAGVGLTIRCAGNGFPVVYSQFLKDGTTGEMNILRKIPNITVLVEEHHFGFSFLMTPEEKVEAKAAYTALFEKVKAAAVEQNARLLVMDEMLDLCNAELIDTAMVVDFLKNRPEQVDGGMSGGFPIQVLVDLADFLTYMNGGMHRFDKGVPA